MVQALRDGKSYAEQGLTISEFVDMVTNKSVDEIRATPLLHLQTEIRDLRCAARVYEKAIFDYVSRVIAEYEALPVSP